VDKSAREEEPDGEDALGDAGGGRALEQDQAADPGPEAEAQEGQASARGSTEAEGGDADGEGDGPERVEGDGGELAHA
jgi:hypothetical protein